MREQPELAYERQRRVWRETDEELEYRIRIPLSNGKVREQEEVSKMEEAFQSVCMHRGRWDGCLHGGRLRTNVSRRPARTRWRTAQSISHCKYGG